MKDARLAAAAGLAAGVVLHAVYTRWRKARDDLVEEHELNSDGFVAFRNAPPAGGHQGFLIWPLYTTVHSCEFDFEIRSKLHSFTVFFPNKIYYRDKYKIIDIRKLCQKNGLSVQKSIRSQLRV